MHVNILAIETSSDACSCALMLTDGSISQRLEVAPRQHTHLLLPMVDSVLSEAGISLRALDCFAFGRGPGSFTGVRIAASAIQGLALAADRPVLGISSLAAVALGESERMTESVLAVFDARMGEVYLAAFRPDAEGLPVAIGEEHLGAPERVALPSSGDWFGAGAGWPVHGEQIAKRLGARLRGVDANRLPSATQIARLAAAPARAGEGTAAEHALPNYLRREVTTPRKSRPGKTQPQT
ncbi:MAG: tRNA threonylcarbamoyladenosine biosynthesis protein TsaB [Gammaproteobacteria bacterium]